MTNSHDAPFARAFGVGDENVSLIQCARGNHALRLVKLGVAGRE